MGWSKILLGWVTCILIETWCTNMEYLNPHTAPSKFLNLYSKSFLCYRQTGVPGEPEVDLRGLRGRDSSHHLQGGCLPCGWGLQLVLQHHLWRDGLALWPVHQPGRVSQHALLPAQVTDGLRNCPVRSTQPRRWAVSPLCLSCYPSR